MTGASAAKATQNPVGSLARNARSFLDPNQVGYLIAYVTNRCNFRCNFCFYSAEIEKGLKPDEMTLDEIRKIAGTIGPLLQLSLTGGEPFLRKDFAEVTRAWLDGTTPRYVTIPTNASLTDRMVRFFEDILPAYPNTYFRLVFSIEGIGEDHDNLRSMPGSFDNIRKSYEALTPLRQKHKNLTMDSNSVFTALSEDKLLDTVKYLDREFDFDNISVTFARGEIEDPALKTMSRRKYEQIFDFLREREKNREGRFLYPLWRAASDVARENLLRVVFDDEFVAPCVAGKKLIVLGETGDVFPCEILGKSIGNVRDYDFDMKALMRDHAAREMQTWIKDTKCKCSFECALSAGSVWSPQNYARMAKNAVRNVGTKDRAQVPGSVNEQKA